MQGVANRIRRGSPLALSVCMLVNWGCAPARERGESPDQRSSSSRSTAGEKKHQDNAPDTTAEKTQPDRAVKRTAAQVVEFQPGIRIDYRVPQVEIDGEVNLRTGELELFAYAKAPTPKEHETILLLKERPEHIFQAMGLIGLTPGNPIRYDWETQKITPATGDPVDVWVQYKQEGKTVEVSACEWMLDLQRQAPMAPTNWIFTGSRRDERGQFTADIEGTVVTVVNFDTALLSLPESHSDSDSSLWLAARTEVIPPKGTPVVLILRPATAPSGSKE